MGSFIKVVFQFSVFVLFIGAIAWFVAFETDVYNVCKDHPQKKKTHLICKPLGFEMKKPEPERKFRDGKF